MELWRLERFVGRFFRKAVIFGLGMLIVLQCVAAEEIKNAQLDLEKSTIVFFSNSASAFDSFENFSRLLSTDERPNLIDGNDFSQNFLGEIPNVTYAYFWVEGERRLDLAMPEALDQLYLQAIQQYVNIWLVEDGNDNSIEVSRLTCHNSEYPVENYNVVTPGADGFPKLFVNLSGQNYAENCNGNASAYLLGLHSRYIRQDGTGCLYRNCAFILTEQFNN